MATNSVKEKNNPNPPAILNAWSILDSSFSEHVGQTNIYGPVVVLVVVISGFGLMVVLFGDAVETVVIMVVSVVLEGFAAVASICTVGLAAAGGGVNLHGCSQDNEDCLHQTRSAPQGTVALLVIR